MNAKKANNVILNDLLDLAIDCTWMITRLGRSLDFKLDGKNAAAVDEIEDVNRLIVKWMDDIQQMDTEAIDRSTLVDNLSDARNSLNDITKLSNRSD